MSQVTNSPQQSNLYVTTPNNKWIANITQCEPYMVRSAQTFMLHMRWGLIKTTSDSYQHLHVLALFAFTGEDSGYILGQYLQCVLLNVSALFRQWKVYKSFSTMAGFRGLWRQFTSWINISCLEVVVCSSSSLCFSHSHHSACVLSIISLLLICKGYGVNTG